MIHTWTFKRITQSLSEFQSEVPQLMHDEGMIARHFSNRLGTDTNGMCQTMPASNRKSEEAHVLKNDTRFVLLASAPACSSSLAHSVWPLSQAIRRGVTSYCTHNRQIMVTMIKWSTHERWSESPSKIFRCAVYDVVPSWTARARWHQKGLSAHNPQLLPYDMLFRYLHETQCQSNSPFHAYGEKGYVDANMITKQCATLGIETHQASNPCCHLLQQPWTTSFNKLCAPPWLLCACMHILRPWQPFWQ